MKPYKASIGLGDSASAYNGMLFFEPSLQNYEGSIYVGKTSIYGDPFSLNLEEHINPHIAVIGMSGTGKTYMMKSIAARACAFCGINILIIDWSGEYNQLVKFLNGRIVDLGSEGIDITEFIKSNGFPDSEIPDILCTLFNLGANDKHLIQNIVYSLIAENKSVCARSLREGLEKLGNEEQLNGLKELFSSSLFSIHPALHPGMLNGCLSINLLGLKRDSERIAVASQILHSLLNEKYKGNAHGTHLNTMIMLDEAWKMLYKDNAIEALFREGRKYGIGVVVATQMASDISNAVIANAACQFIFKLQSPKDYEMLERIGIAKEDTDALAWAGVGSCIVRLSRKGGTTEKFMLDKVDGLVMDFVELIGVGMRVYITLRRMSEAGRLLEKDQADAISARLAETGNKVHIADIIGVLVKKGASRALVIAYLHSLGVDDKNIVVAYEIASKK